MLDRSALSCAWQKYVSISSRPANFKHKPVHIYSEGSLTVLNVGCRDTFLFQDVREEHLHWRSLPNPRNGLNPATLHLVFGHVTINDENI